MASPTNYSLDIPMVEGLFEVSIKMLSKNNCSSTTPHQQATEADAEFYNYFYKIIVPALFGFIAFVGGIGNILVVIIILAKPKMRTRMNILLLNLALSDIIFLILCVPFGAYRYAADTWNIGELICKLSEYLIYVTMYVTMYTLVLISIIRYLIVVIPTQSSRYTSRINICLMITGIWIVNLVCNIHIYINYKVKSFVVTGSEPYKYCGIETVAIGRSFFMTFFIFAYILPLFLISIFYILLLRHLKITRESSSLRHLRHNNHNDSRPPRYTHSASRILIRVVAVLAICWLPLHIHFLLAYFGQLPKSRAYMIYRVFCHCLAYSNSCMNPVIYNFVSMDFQSSFRMILFCKHPRKNGKNACPQVIALDNVAGM